MTPTLRVELDTGDLERAESPLAVVSFFETDRPLRGAASRADWRLCGMLSRLVASGRLTGAAGEALLVPTFRRMRAPRLLLVGLGPTSPFGAAEVSRAVLGIVDRVLDLGLPGAAIGIPGDWIGAVPVRPAAEASARGALESLARRRASLGLRLMVSEAGAGRALRGLEAAASRAKAGGITLQLPDLEPEAGSPVRPARSLGPSRTPVSPAPGRP